MPDDKPTADDSARLLAEAVQALVKQNIPPTSSPPPEDAKDDPSLLSEESFQSKIEELTAAGETSEAMRLMRMRSLRDTQKTTALGATLFAENAKLLAQHQLSDLEKWLPEIEKTARERNVDLKSFTSVNQWKEALDYVKTQNLPKILEEERAKLLAEVQKGSEEPLPSFARGSRRDADVPADDQIIEAEASSVYRRFSELTGTPLKSYMKNARVLEQFDQGDGSIEKAPLIDSDIESKKKTGQIVIERGKF